MLGKVAILLIAWLIASSAVAPSKEIKVSGGLVEGTVEEGLRVYRGIPFAAPPVGDLRWRAPAPVVSWNGIRLANQFAPACPQGGITADGKFKKDVSEDCLYLNIWTPARTPRASLPVMVWIHGSGFRLGATSWQLSSGDQLAKHGVVVVSIAYRLGVFGFAAFPDASGSPNFGLLDQIAALEWVKRNIKAFGGDPRKVTLFGQSAGAMSSSLLAASPLAKGLFRGVIADSGAAFWVATSQEPRHGATIATLLYAQAAGARLEKTLGAASVAQMRAMDAPKVLSAARDMAGIGWPIQDGEVIDGDQYDRYLAGRYNKTPVLIGINSDEGYSFSQVKDAADYVAQTRKRFGPFADELLELYPATPQQYLQSSRDVLRDAAFAWQDWTWATLQSRTGGPPVYVYYFAQRPPYAAGSDEAGATGVPDMEELPYVFGHLGQYDRPWRPEDREISSAVLDYWTNFAKRGNPNGKGLPQWPAFSVKDQQRMVFKGSPHLARYDDLKRLGVLDAWYAWMRKRK